MVCLVIFLDESEIDLPHQSEEDFDESTQVITDDWGLNSGENW